MYATSAGRQNTFDTWRISDFRPGAAVAGRQRDPEESNAARRRVARESERTHSLSRLSKPLKRSAGISVNSLKFRFLASKQARFGSERRTARHPFRMSVSMKEALRCKIA